LIIIMINEIKEDTNKWVNEFQKTQMKSWMKQRR
jgi:hypothetical protein